MTVLQALVLGIVQGLGEFLPISSTAHLVLTPWVFGWPDPGLSFDVALHIGTLVALLLFFRAEWFQLLQGGISLLSGQRRAPNAQLALHLILATIPALIVGALLSHFADTTLRHPMVIASALIVLALVLVIAERVSRRKIELKDISMGDALAVGCAQALAIIPGA